jgi:hypothetical protein
MLIMQNFEEIDSVNSPITNPGSREILLRPIHDDGDDGLTEDGFDLQEGYYRLRRMNDVYDAIIAKSGGDR